MYYNGVFHVKIIVLTFSFTRTLLPLLPLSLSSSVEILHLYLPVVELNVYSSSPRTILPRNVHFVPLPALLFPLKYLSYVRTEFLIILYIGCDSVGCVRVC
jgi:hypothetical protein